MGGPEKLIFLPGLSHVCLCLFHCSGGHLDIVTFLVTTGRVDINSKNNKGETPLHKACT